MDSTLYVWNSKIFTCKEVRIDTSPANLAQYENFIVCMYYKSGTVYVAVKNAIMGYDVKVRPELDPAWSWSLIFLVC